MKRNYNLEKGYTCPECGADVESAGGPDFMVAWRCKNLNCEWGTVQDTYDPDVPENVTKREKMKDYES
jgi:ribosomal protein L37AE/L43A